MKLGDRIRKIVDSQLTLACTYHQGRIAEKDILTTCSLFKVTVLPGPAMVPRTCGARNHAKYLW